MKILFSKFKIGFALRSTGINPTSLKWQRRSCWRRKRKMAKLSKLAKLAGVGLLGLLGLNYAGRHVTRNVMSHCGYREESCDFATPNTYLTRGYYKGFVNLFVYPEILTKYYSEDDPDPKNFMPDPYNELSEPLHGVDLNSVYLGLEKKTFQNLNIAQQV